MKKAIIALAAIALVSCGGAQQEEVKVDSLQVIDSVKVDSSLTASDSTVAEIPVIGNVETKDQTPEDKDRESIK